MKIVGHVALAALIAAAGMGCGGTRVTVPPRVNLSGHQTIGIVEFSSNADGDMQKLATQKFIEMIQSSQPNVAVLELGNLNGVLHDVRRQDLDFTTVKAIGKRYDVGAVVIGTMQVTDVKPSISVTSVLSTMGVSADAEASLTVRLYDTASGATVWTDAARAKQNIAHASVSGEGPVSVGAHDPDSAYGKLVNGLVYEITRDFRVTYARR